jgi:hypothetical protein
MEQFGFPEEHFDSTLVNTISDYIAHVVLMEENLELKSDLPIYIDGFPFPHKWIKFIRSQQIKKKKRK